MVIFMLSLEQIADSVQTVASEYPIRKAEVFGSYAENRVHDKSDVDLLVEFTTPSVSLLTISGVQCRLEELLQTDVDVIHAPLPQDSIITINRRIPVYGA